MPLYEYACKECTHEFETLVRGDEAPTCPACHATALTKRLSTFAPRTAGGAASVNEVPMGGCGACGDPRGPGSCSIN